MFLVELVMQGVRGVRDLVRLRYQSGFNIIVAGNESGKTTSVDTMLRLLFPSNQPGQMDALISRATPDVSRGALVVQADDSVYYRVIQDFSKRAVNLSKYNAATKDFVLTNKDWDSTAQFMSGLTGGIAEGEFARLFVLRRDHYSTAAGSPEPAATPRTAAPRAARPGRDTSGMEARLDELREALKKSEEAADADYRHQSAKLRLDELKKKLDALGELEQRAGEIDAGLETLSGCDTLPEDLKDLLTIHEERQGQKMAKSDELTQDIEDLKMRIDSLPQSGLMSDKLFIVGILLAVLSVVAGLFVLENEQREYFPLGVLASLVPIGIAMYKSSQKGNERKVLRKEMDELQAELSELEKSFEQGGADILKCMEATGSETAAELREKADNYQYFRSLRNDIDEQFHRLAGEAGPDGVRAEFASVEQEVAELETEAAALSPYAIDSYALRQDIERIEMELGGRDADSDLGLSDDFGFAAPPPAAPRTEGFVTELAIASRISGIEIETLVPAAAAAAQRNFSTVTNGKYVRIDLGDDGGPVVQAKDNSVVSVSEMSHGTRDLLYFCLRTGLVEAIAGKRRLPLVLDDPLAGFDPGRQQAACQILRSLGTKTQVIFLTSNPGLRSAGDAAAELK